MANFLLIFYIASACIDSYASEHNMMRNFKLFLMPALMAYLSFHANHDVLLYGIAGCLYLKLILPVVPASFKKATIVYMITILFMSLMAYVNMIKTMNILSWLGSIVFLISDTLLSYQTYTKSPQRGVMETYSIAQLLIVLGVIYASGV